MGAFTANAAVAIGVLVAGVATILAVVGSVAYARLRHARLLWVAIAFALFAVQGVVLIVQAVDAGGEAPFPTLGILSLAILAALYIAVLRR
jgi:drug/metabolite transporter (DMT)-like permease